MVKSSITPLSPSPFMTKRLIDPGSYQNTRMRQRSSRDLSLQVIQNFKNTSKVRDGMDYGNFKSNKISKPKRNLTSKVLWWEPPIECLPFDFCRDTSLHGLKYIGQPKRHLSERIFWMLAFLTGFCVAVYLISDVWRKYKDSPVIVTFEASETNIDKIPFPAVTICNMNKVLKSIADEYIAAAKRHKGIDELRNVYNLDHVCTSSKSFTSRFNYSSPRGFVDKNLVNEATNQINPNDTNPFAIQEFLKKASQPCSEMIPLCIWHDKIVSNCSALFRPIETEFGKCCTFNMVPQTLLRTFQNDTRDDEKETEKWKLWNTDQGGLFPSEESNPKLEFPRRQIRAGKSFGLSILLDPDLDEYFCTNSDSVGFRLSTHTSTETPNVIDFGLGINPSQEVFLDIRPEITKAESTIGDYELGKRQCYFPGEKTLLYYSYYTVANCVDECVANVTYRNCSCVRFYMPRDNNQSLCEPDKFQCVEGIKGDLAEIGLKKSCDHCLPSCSDINYSSQTTSTPMQEAFDIWDKDDTQRVAAKWSKNKVSVVHVYFGTDSTYARLRKQLYGVTDLIANTGGLMGLCLGFSGLSAMEVLYFLSLRAWCKVRRKKTFGNRVAKKFRDVWAKLKALKTYGKFSRENSSGRPGFENKSLPDGFINVKPRLTPMRDNSLPDYSSVVNEINPYYSRRHWQHLEMNSEL